MLDAVVELWVAGGFVMPPLFACTAVLWYALGWRIQSLRRGDRRPLAALLRVVRSGGKLDARGVVNDAVARRRHGHRPNRMQKILKPCTTAGQFVVGGVSYVSSDKPTCLF